MNNKTLKPGWRRVKFGDVVRLSKARSQDPLADGIERYVGLEHLEPGDLRIRSWGNVADGVTFTSLFQPGQVLFGKRRAYQRKVAVADFAGVCSGDIYVLETKDAQVLLPELLPFICQTDAFFDHAVSTSAGSLSPRTNWTSLADFEFSLPPMDEQQKILELMKAFETAIDELRVAEFALNKLRASLAVEKFSESRGRQSIPCSELISDGRLTLQTGPFGTVLKASAYRTEGIPIINPVNMKDGKLDVSEGPFIGTEDWQRLQKYWMQTGDMVMGRKGDMSNLIFVSPEYNDYLVGSDCIRFRVKSDEIDPRYFFHFLRSEVTQNWIQGQAYGTVMPGINEKILGRLKAHIPSIDEQRNIAAEFDEIEVSVLAMKQRRTDARLLKLIALRNVFDGDLNV
ncbi:restriction endonuclease subunit S [Halothiobacillus sp.]|uniref:restriction endonuclease subunit S n=1 Tax=Halothiobacillus sp. TaxID=1891311 RepID=UPI00262A2102|nr:restriction endonuclease subunit S [Halothiobacillus sp.]MDD4965989.1 restriction endonuclease subunit S [Halothiobacillus sp.]